MVEQGHAHDVSSVNWVLAQGKPRKSFILFCLDVVIIMSCFVLAMPLRLTAGTFPTIIDLVRLYPIVPISIIGLVKAGSTGPSLGLFHPGSRVLLASLVSGAAMFGELGPWSPDPVYTDHLCVVLCGCRVSVWFARHCQYGYGKTSRERGDLWGRGCRYKLNALNIERNFRVIAYVDDDEAMQGREMDTIPIFPPRALSDLKQKYSVSLVLLAAPSAGTSQRRRIISLVAQHALQLRSIPSVSDIVSGKARVNDFEDIDVEDLLAREIVPPIPDLIAMRVEAKSVVVTGAGGSIGSELCRQIITLKPKKLLLYEMSEHALYQVHKELTGTIQNEGLDIEIMPFLGSVQNKQRLVHLFSECQAATVFHAAAYKHVPLVEQNVIDGIVNNVFGTRMVVKAAIEAGVETFTLISTDKAVRPTNFMGASKRLSELVCQAYARRKEYKDFDCPLWQRDVVFRFCVAALQRTNHEWWSHHRNTSRNHSLFHDYPRTYNLYCRPVRCRRAARCSSWIWVSRLKFLMCKKHGTVAGIATTA